MTQYRHADSGDQDGFASEEAAAWFARLRADNCSTSDKRRFREWLRQSPNHIAAFRHHQHVWDDIAAAATDADILVMRNAALTAHGRHRFLHWQHYAAIAASVLVVLVSATVLSFSTQTEGERAPLPTGTQIAQSDVPTPSRTVYQTPSRTVYQTQTGQRSSINLPDGSVVELNTDSMLQVSYSPDRRGLVLLKGEAFFEVAKDPDRPFVVSANDKRVTAVGTAFSVRMDADQVRVTLVEGVVTVGRGYSEDSFMAAEDRTVETLRAGEQLLAVKQQPFRKREIDTEVATSWRQGRLIFDNEPLSRIVPEINRYTTRKIVIGDETLSNMRVSGSFRAGSTDNFAKTLEITFPVSVETDDRRNRLILHWKK